MEHVECRLVCNGRSAISGTGLAARRSGSAGSLPGFLSSADPVQWSAWFESKRLEQRMVHLTLRDLESEVAMKIKRNELGQSILLFAILMPVMSLFLLGI